MRGVLDKDRRHSSRTVYVRVPSRVVIRYRTKCNATQSAVFRNVAQYWALATSCPTKFWRVRSMVYYTREACETET